MRRSLRSVEDRLLAAQGRFYDGEQDAAQAVKLAVRHLVLIATEDGPPPVDLLAALLPLRLLRCRPVHPDAVDAAVESGLAIAGLPTRSPKVAELWGHYLRAAKALRCDSAAPQVQSEVVYHLLGAAIRDQRAEKAAAAAVVISTATRVQKGQVSFQNLLAASSALWNGFDLPQLGAGKVGQCH